MEILREITAGLVVVLVAVAVLGTISWINWKRHNRSKLGVALKNHFRPTRLDELTVTERQFPPQIRADLQVAIDAYLEQAEVGFFTGVQKDYNLGGVDFTSLLDESPNNTQGSVNPGPPQYEHIDIGEDEPVRILQSGLWLLKRDHVPLAILFAPVTDFGGCGVEQRLRIQVASPNDVGSIEASESFLRHLEGAVEQARSYRGKVLSLEGSDHYSGQSVGVKVHRIANVPRDRVILPQTTLELLERNVVRFIEQRSRLAEFGMTTKKGLLFYGPPGTGKTHTIRYLSASLEGHTTFLISAEQVALLSQYMTLARLLQPSVVVIEDVDLIARDRGEMHNPATESLLNRLLNEMDGLREDASILFILTTNRPEDLESALASRPGRIDQAIEFPLPDAKGRAKLVDLYCRGLNVSGDVIDHIVERTDGVSASFIKELMRRSAQCYFERDGADEVVRRDVDQALDEMLFAGGSLNVSLLGAEAWSDSELRSSGTM